VKKTTRISKKKRQGGWDWFNANTEVLVTQGKKKSRRLFARQARAAQTNGVATRLPVEEGRKEKQKKEEHLNSHTFPREKARDYASEVVDAFLYAGCSKNEQKNFGKLRE